MTENGRNGFTLWFTGLSGAGKTTIAEGEEERAGRWAGSDKLECGIHAPRRREPGGRAARRGEDAR